MSEAHQEKFEIAPERLVLRDNLDSVELRQMTIEDAALYFALVDADRGHLSQFGDKTAHKYQTVEDVEKSVTNPDGEQHRFGIWDNDTMVGFIKLKFNDKGDWESGSWVGSQHTGNKYAARARRLLIDYAFQVLHAPRVVSKIKVGNEAGRKSVESNGYHLASQTDAEWVMVIENPAVGKDV